MRERCEAAGSTRWAVLVVVSLLLAGSGAAPVPAVAAVAAGAVAPSAAAPVQSEVLFTFQDPAIVESSALAFTVGGRLLTSNDSGDTGRIFSEDPATGRTVAVTRWSNDPVDVEALAPAVGRLVWVGDIGDNQAVRTTIQVASVLVGTNSSTVTPPIYQFAYPDGPHNAETLMADPATNRLYIATKSKDGGELYEAPSTLVRNGINQLTPISDVIRVATDGAFFPDGKHVVIRNYSQAAIYDFPSMEHVFTVDLPAEPQGEGIAVDSRNRLLLSSEGAHTDVLRVTLPAGALAR